MGTDDLDAVRTECFRTAMETAREQQMPGESTTWLAEHRIDASSLTPDVVVGEAHAMGELQSIAGRLRHPDVVVACGGELPRGLLLSAPPGLGKTTSARWLARTIGDDVPVYEIGADELTPARVRSVFRELAGQRSVLVIDEIDLVGVRREWLKGSREQAALRALLSALDGLQNAPGVLVVATTTRSAYELDPALIRPGRIGIHITLEAPSEADRRGLLEVFGRGRALGPDIDWAAIAKRTEGWSPAELRQMLDDALGIGLAADRLVMSQADVLAAVRRNGAINPPPQAAPPWWDARRAGIHEAGHLAVALGLLGPASVTTVRLDDGIGGVTIVGGISRPLSAMSNEELLARTATAYGGLVAEETVLGSAFAAGSDIAMATSLLEARTASGLDRSLPPLSLGELADRTPESLRRLFARAIARDAEWQLARARAIVETREAEIEAFAETLEDAGELEGDALSAAIRDAGFDP